MRNSCYNRLHRRMVVDAETQSMIEGDVVVDGDGRVVVKRLFKGENDGDKSGRV
jgi:hypothetical protein